MALTRDDLVSRLTRELYDLKYKLEEIRDNAEYACKELDRIKTKDNQLKIFLNSIINLVDDGEFYERN